jgi:hypothetical protein
MLSIDITLVDGVDGGYVDDSLGRHCRSSAVDVFSKKSSLDL